MSANDPKRTPHSEPHISAKADIPCSTLRYSCLSTLQFDPIGKDVRITKMHAMRTNIENKTVAFEAS
jgi:hypothetical protein